VEEPLREGEIALQLGSGKIKWPGWVNIDSYDERADMKADIFALPFPEGYADRIAAIHLFEHLYPWETSAFLAECRRVLKEGGKLILELPCMNKVFGHITHRINKKEQPETFFSWLPIWGDPSYKRPEMLHKWGYFKGDMEKVLRGARFENIQDEEPHYHFPIRDMRFTAVKPKGAANGT
jgi:ubiquinone/menaquinone biosynthesis C-methylase UbiE